MKRKVLSSIAASVAIMMALTACGGQNKEAETNNSSSQAAEKTAESSADLIISWWGNQTRNERTQSVLDLYEEKNAGIAFDGQFAEWADYWNKLSTASAGHTLPDIVQMDYKYLEQYVSNNLLVDLKPYIESGALNVDGIDENILNSGKIGEGIYAIPIGINAPVLMYNKTLLDEKGITVKDNMNMEEFYSLCNEIFEKTGYKTDVSYGNGDNYIEFMMRSKGKILYESKGIGASQEDLESFFDVYEKGISEGWICDPSIYSERSIGTPEQMPLVYGSSPSNMSWCAFSYSNALSALQNAAPEGVEIGMTTWPADNLSAANYLKPGMFFSITVDSKNPEKAAEFIDFWTNDVEANEILLGERGVPASSDTAASIAPKMDQASQSIIKFINDVVTPNSSVVNPPASEGSAEVSKLVDQLVEKVCYKQMTAAEAAETLYTQGNKMMDK